MNEPKSLLYVYISQLVSIILIYVALQLFSLVASFVVLLPFPCVQAVHTHSEQTITAFWFVEYLSGYIQERV
jgi:hypothetical protein